MVLYKHGVGFIQRGSKFTGDAPVKLKFKKAEMDDILKSLSIFDSGKGRVTGVSYETAEDISKQLSEKAITVPDREALVGLLRHLCGYDVRLKTTQGELEGKVMGTQEDEAADADNKRTPRNIVVIQDADSRVIPVMIDDIVHFEVLTGEAKEDLAFFLDAVSSQRKKNIKNVTVFLDGKDHDVSVNYIVSMPSWRVSYRIAYDKKAKTILQGWGIIDNQLDEDLKDISLSLVAGKPISFIYDIYAPRIVPRPVVREEVRTVSAPVDLESGVSQYEEAPMEMEEADYRMEAASGMARAKKSMKAAMPMSAPAPMPTADALAQSASVQTRTVEMGEFFKYDIETPVTVKRGQSAMVPILQCPVTCEKEHVYNAQKMPVNPVVTMKITNDTGAVLERGPILVLEDGTYVGEAILPYTTNGSVNHIAYSVDLGVEVKEEHNSGSNLTRVYISNRYFQKVHLEWKETVYKVTNKKSDEIDLVIEHPKSNYKVDEDTTPKPQDQTDSFYRWKFKVKPKTTSDFKVREVTTTSYSEYIRDVGLETLKEYHRKDWVKKPDFDRISHILELVRSIAVLNREKQELENEKNGIISEQERLRQNLESLGNTQKEDTLRAKYVDKMDQQENRFEQIKTRQAEIATKIASIEKDINARLGELRNG